MLEAKRSGVLWYISENLMMLVLVIASLHLSYQKFLMLKIILNISP